MDSIGKPANSLTSKSNILASKAQSHKASTIPTSNTLAKNETIRGLVTDIRPGQITLRLSNKQVVTANYEGNKEVSIGDVASFKITDTSGKHITVTKLNSPVTPEDLTVIKALEEANLPVNEQNREIVKELLYHKLPITKESINHILKQAMQFKGASMSTLIYLNKNNLPLTEDYISKFESYRNFEFHLFDQITSIQDEFTKFLSQAVAVESDSAFVPLTKELLHFLNIEETIPGDLENPSLTLSQKEQTALTSLLSPYEMPEELAEQLETSSVNLRFLYRFITEAISKASHSSLEEVEAFKNPLVFSIFEQHAIMQQANDELASYLPTSSRMQLLDAIAELPITAEEAQQIAHGDITTDALLMLIASHTANSNVKGLRSLLKSSSFHELLDHKLQDVFTLKPEDMKKSDAVSDYYNSLLDKVSHLNDGLNAMKLQSDTSGISNKSEHLNNQMDFMKSFNELFTYVQLPIKLKEQITHGDLYVYTNKKKLQEGTDSISVLLHLDLTHLGPLDIHLSLTHRSVHSKFYVTDKQTKSLLAKHASELKTSLSNIGFTLTNEFLEQLKEPDILKDLVETETKTEPIRRYSFDLRA